MYGYKIIFEVEVDQNSIWFVRCKIVFQAKSNSQGRSRGEGLTVLLA